MSSFRLLAAGDVRQEPNVAGLPCQSTRAWRSAARSDAQSLCVTPEICIWPRTPLRRRRAIPQSSANRPGKRWALWTCRYFFAGIAHHGRRGNWRNELADPAPWSCRPLRCLPPTVVFLRQTQALFELLARGGGVMSNYHPTRCPARDWPACTARPDYMPRTACRLALHLHLGLEHVSAAPLPCAAPTCR